MLRWALWFCHMIDNISSLSGFKMQNYGKWASRLVWIKWAHVTMPENRHFETNHLLWLSKVLVQFFGVMDPKHFWSPPFATFFQLRPKVFPIRHRNYGDNKIRFLSFAILFAKSKHEERKVCRITDDDSSCLIISHSYRPRNANVVPSGVSTFFEKVK